MVRYVFGCICEYDSQMFLEKTTEIGENIAAVFLDNDEKKSL